MADRKPPQPREQFSLKLSKEVSKAVRQVARRRRATIAAVLERLAMVAEASIKKDCEKLNLAMLAEQPAETALFPATEH